MCIDCTTNRAGYIGIYTPNQSTLNVFLWLFCLLDPFILTQIKFLATPLESRALKMQTDLKRTQWFLNHTQLAPVDYCYPNLRLQSCIIKQTTV